MEENVKNASVLIGVLTFIAYIKQYTYYWYFGIDISSYIGLEEVFIPFLDDLAINGLFLFIAFIYAKTKDRVLVVVTKDNVEKTRKANQNLRLAIISMGAGCLGAFLFGAFQIYWITQNVLILLMIITFVVAVVMDYIVFHHTDIITKYYTKYPSSVTVGTIMSYIIIINLGSNIINIINKETEHLHVIHRFILNDTTEILTDANNIYIGKTKTHLFMKKQINNRISIYNSSTIIYEEEINKNE